jgi:type IV pilus assembly protein PilE
MRANRGFTLIEVIIVVAIIGILAAIAYPSYQNQIRRSNRSAAQAVMMDAANKQQFYLSSQRQYLEAATTADMATIGVTPPVDVTRFYDFAIAANNAATPPTFTITATPKGPQTPDGALTLDQAGTKAPVDKW